MRKKTFIFLFSFILLFALALRIVPALGNNFYFTMDQGNDAADIREIWVRHQVLLAGPSSAINGLFTGCLWFYFITVGYSLFRGNPFGGLLMIVLLNVGLTALVMKKVAKTDRLSALILGIGLQIFWPFYNASRYAFNPFPTVFLVIATIFELISALDKKKNSFIWAAVFVGLCFHSELTVVIPLFAFYLLVGIFLIFRKKVTLDKYLLGIVVVLFFLSPRFISELTNNFNQSNSLINYLSKPNPLRGTNFSVITQEFIKMVGETILPQKTSLGALFAFFSFLFFFQLKNKNNLFPKRFLLLSLLLILITYFWFSSNKGWQTWHTVFVPTLLFICVVLMLLNFPKKIGYPLLISVLFLQLIFFRKEYQYYFRPSNDPSLLKNELKAVDWVYEKAQGQGFNVYNYLPSVFDYPYQYLFWWRGTYKYSYLPCEFASYPNAPKLFILGRKYYEEPKRLCTNIRFLIVEPDKHLELRQKWLDNLRANTKLLETTNIGKVLVEKREVIR